MYPSRDLDKYRLHVAATCMDVALMCTPSNNAPMPKEIYVRQVSVWYTSLTIYSILDTIIARYVLSNVQQFNLRAIQHVLCFMYWGRRVRRN